MSEGAGEAAGHASAPRHRPDSDSEEIDDALEGLVSTVDALVRDLAPDDAEPSPPAPTAPAPPQVNPEPERVRAPRAERRPRAPLTGAQKVALTIGAILLVLVVEYGVLHVLLGQG
jgi:hypothetical protein